MGLIPGGGTKISQDTGPKKKKKDVFLLVSQVDTAVRVITTAVSFKVSDVLSYLSLKTI